MRQFLPNGQRLDIRSPSTADAAACLACFRQVTGETDFLLYTHEEALAFDIPAEEDFIRSYIEHPDHLYLIADVEGEVAGSLTLNSSKFRKQRHMALLGMAVQHKFWNMGIGRRLMTAAIRWVEQHPEIAVIHFEVLANNERAIQLYRNFNFTENGRMPNAIRQPDGSLADLVSMSRQFKPL